MKCEPVSRTIEMKKMVEAAAAAAAGRAGVGPTINDKNVTLQVVLH